MTQQERIPSMPLAPRLLFAANRAEIDRRAGGLETHREHLPDRLFERHELASKLHAMQPDNPIWAFAKDFFASYAGGTQASWDLLRSLNAISPDGSIVMPKGWRETPMPREFMDLTPRIFRHLYPTGWNSRKEELFEIQLGQASRASFLQFEMIKGGLMPPFGEKVPLLTSGVTDETLRAVEQFGCNCVCVIGMGTDEVAALKDKGLIVIGLNWDVSTQMDALIRQGDVRLIPKNLTRHIIPREAGVYIIKDINVTEGIPLPDDSVILMQNYVMHHIPENQRDNLINDMARVSKSRNGSTERAIIIGEAVNSSHLLAMILQTNAALANETAAFDAVISTYFGADTQATLLEALPEMGIPVVGREIPAIPPFLKGILPVQQMLLTCYEPL